MKNHISNYLYGAEASRNNAMQLRNISNTLLKWEGSKQMSVFSMFTAIEEIQKAIFCLFAHRKWMTGSIISQVFSDHEAKSILFHEIYHGTFEIENNKAILNGKDLTSDNLKLLIKKHKPRIKARMDYRNNCIYVGRAKKWLEPKKTISNPELAQAKLMIELTALANFYETIRDNQIDTMVNNFRIESKIRNNRLEAMTISYDQI